MHILITLHWFNLNGKVGLPTQPWEITGDLEEVPEKGKVWGEEGGQQTCDAIVSLPKLPFLSLELILAA